MLSWMGVQKAERICGRMRSCCQASMKGSPSIMGRQIPPSNRGVDCQVLIIEADTPTLQTPIPPLCPLSRPSRRVFRASNNPPRRYRTPNPLPTIHEPKTPLLPLRKRRNRTRRTYRLRMLHSPPSRLQSRSGNPLPRRPLDLRISSRRRHRGQRRGFPDALDQWGI